MEVNILQVLTEYISMLCIVYKLSKRKIALKPHKIAGLIINAILVLACMYYPVFDIRIRICASIIILIGFKYLFAFSWKEAVKYFGLMMVITSGLELLFFRLIGARFSESLGIETVGIIGNCSIIFAVMIIRRKYVDIVVEKILCFKESIFIIVYVLYFVYLFYVLDKTKELDVQMQIQALLGLTGILLVAILWMNTEKEKKHKAEELRAYELYTKSFEETIAAIRMKQHEFKNHINAIMCMQYTIQDEEELKNAQMNYCQEILREQSLNDLLKVQMSPVIIGYLYSKFTFALDKQIFVKYNIQDVSLENNIGVHNLIEIIGILFDNAVEALIESEDPDKQIYVQIGMNEEEKFFIEIANVSRKFGMNEIEAFFQYGNSTKGEGRGVGLYQAKKLAEKCDGVIHVANMTYDERNYISFRVVFRSLQVHT